MKPSYDLIASNGENAMQQPKYQRDLFDGAKQYFSEHLQRPDTDQRYFDDMVQTAHSKDTAPSLEFLFFGTEQSSPNRSHNRTVDNYILHYVTDGKGSFNGRQITAGQGFLVTPGVPHKMISDSREPWHFKWVAFRGSHARPLLKSVGLDENRPYFDFSFDARMETLFDEVIYGECGECNLNTYMTGVFYILLSYHQRQYRDRLSDKDTASNYALRAIRYIDEHYREPISVDRIAATLHISRKYLCSLMEELIGVSTKEYLLRRRVDAAAELLLHTDLTVSEIAERVGYADYTQFSRLFRLKKGCSPLQFRKQNHPPQAERA